MLRQWLPCGPKRLVSYLSGQEMITGRAAVQAFWQSGFDQGAYDLVLESPEIKSLGD
jgi:hypothetical protein